MSIHSIGSKERGTCIFFQFTPPIPFKKAYKHLALTVVTSWMFCGSSLFHFPMAISTLQPLAYGVAYATFSLGILSVFLRIYCRLVILKSWGWDDYVAMVVGAVSVGQQVVLHLFLAAGCGLHQDTLELPQVLRILKILFVEEVYYYVVHFVIKSAFLLFYLRLSPSKVFKTFVYVGMGTNTAIFITNTFMAFFQCVPFDEIFHPGTHPDAKCINKLLLLLFPSILNILQDLYILILPITTVLGLQMPTRRKVAVLAVISFGASAVLVASMRLIPLVELNASPDTSFVLGKMVIVAAIEIQLAIIAVNLPSLKAIWNKITGGSSVGEYKKYNGSRSYKLSDMKGRSSDARGGIGVRSKVKRGSVTRMEQGMTRTDSEEELFRKIGGHSQEEGTRDIVVTTEVAMTSEDQSRQGHGHGFSRRF
ncbi:hypothetical protein BDV96DRAFT_580269 [Lophiotrema nucula]|uniref:Rhodopsin domain-containing protein n=1 Tax=Lophiotrema nucula TaxID=690887 RepID=A0A6A5Z0U2_9PLEO|nr:hypothetical protein BDV96DRAFT_580269 [Lophiotrema nucula]